LANRGGSLWSFRFGAILTRIVSGRRRSDRRMGCKRYGCLRLRRFTKGLGASRRRRSVTAARCASLSRDGCPGALRSTSPSGPCTAVHGIVRWRIVDLCQWIWEEHRGIVAKQTLSRDLRNMGYRRLSARPRHHAQAEGAIEDFKKASPRTWKKSGAKKGGDPGAIELGSPTRRGSARRTRSPAVGPGAARARALQSIHRNPRLGLSVMISESWY
jgi:hypothetical protein